MKMINYRLTTGHIGIHISTYEAVGGFCQLKIYGIVG